MTTLYQNLLNLQQSAPSSAKATGRRSSISLPVTACAHYIGRLTQHEHRQKKKLRKSVKFPTAVLLQQAIIDGDVQEVKQILSERGSCVASEKEPSGVTPAIRCVFESRLDALRLLVEAGADLSATDDEGWTPLHVAASLDDTEAGRYILSQGKQSLVFGCNADGERAIDLAESPEMARLLLNADLKSNETASEGEDSILSLVRDHHRKNGDCRALDDAMRTGTSYDSLLHLAAGKNYTRLASYLLRHRLCELEARDRKGRTPLHTAAYFNNIDAALLLVQCGASTHALTNSYEKASDLTCHRLIRSILQEEYL